MQPVKSKQESEEAKSFKSNIISVRMNKYRKGKSQYYNNYDLTDHKSNRQETKSNDKNLNSFKCSNDSTANSFISEDTNLSSTSTCSNNNVNLNVAKRKRCRSLSKTSDESTLSNARSSGYDTTTFSEKSVFDESSQMFKGFANTETDNCSIGIIKEMLNDLKSEIDEEKKANERESNSGSELESKDNTSTTLSCKSTTDSCDGTLTCEKDETKSFWDNLSSSLKTDDEKLKEIINSGGSKLPENMYLKSLSAVDDFSDSSTITCKSDDEKLSETKNSDSTLSAIENSDRKVTFTKSFSAFSSSSESLNKDVTKREHFGKTKSLQSVTETKLNDSEEMETVSKRYLRKRTRLRSYYKRIQFEINADKKVSKTVNVVKDEGKILRNDKTDEMNIKSDIEDSDDSTNNIRYNLQNSNNPKTEERQEHFNNILSDLSVSDFHLVADSVDGLRDLISIFKTRNSETNNADSVSWNYTDRILYILFGKNMLYFQTKETTCETKLIEKLIELLNNVGSMETIAKDATRKAKAKLQREWFNFKEGYV